MEVGTPLVPDAVDRPDAAVLGEVRRVRRVPVLGVATNAPASVASSVSALMTGIVASPPVTLNEPFGSAKSFWTSTTTSAVRGP
jgi:hypothetical protein